MYDYSKIDKRINNIIKKVGGYMPSFDSTYVHDEIYKAYLYAREAHEGVFRLSGAPYISHPVEATSILLDLKPDIFTIQACLLHDVIEDTPRTYDDIKETFGEEVAFLCAGMEKISKIKYKGEERNVGSLRKMFIAMAEDLRVVFIKLADRLHNMRTLKFHPKKDKRDRIALETLNIYAPIADRLGLYSLKNNLEEECFKILQLKEYRKIKKELKELSTTSFYFIKNAENEIEKLLKSVDIKNYIIDYRIKSIFSIYKKMKKKGLDSSKGLHDLFGIRIIVNDVSECYKILGLIHNKWKPLPKKFKDYIALPKPNGYKSLHTTIIGLLKDHLKQPAEIQIKTHEMREYSDIGVAAHFEYKEKGSTIAKDIDWVKELKELTEGLENSDFMSSLKVDVFRDRIFAFTPKGDSINLPAGSTPIDFAYYVHTDLGNHIVLAKVNGRVYPMDKDLHNGDVVEIVVDKNKKPNPFWLSFVKTTKAKNCIKSCLKKEDVDEYIERGKEIVNKYLLKAGLKEFNPRLSLLKHLDGKKYNYNERLSILEQVGNFSITPSNLIKRILKSPGVEDFILEKTKKPSNIIKNKEDEKSKGGKKELIIGGEENISYFKCHCCRRKLPKKIVAHINSKGVINIHRRDCHILDKVNTDRLLSAYIKGEENHNMIVKVNLLLENKIGVLKEISDIIYSMGINIDQINTKKESISKSRVCLDLEILDYDYLIINRLIERLKFSLDKTLLQYKIDKIED